MGSTIKSKIFIIFLLTTVCSLLIAFTYTILSQNFVYCFLLYLPIIGSFFSVVSYIRHLKNIHPERDVMLEIIGSFVSAFYIPLIIFIVPFFMNLKPFKEAISEFVVTFVLILLISHIKYVRRH